MIDLTSLNLTTPEPKFEGSPGCITYAPGKFPVDCPYFKVLENGDIEMSAPTKGASSKSTSRTRTEVRETNPNNTQINWAYDSADHHWLQAALTVVQAPKGGETVVGQIHVKDATTPPLKLSWDNGKIIVGFRAMFPQPNPVDSILLEDVPLGERWTYSIHVVKSGTMSIGITHAGRSASIILKFDPSWLARKLYFKAGVYNQEDPTDTTTEDEGSKAIFHKLVIRHETA